MSEVAAPKSFTVAMLAYPNMTAFDLVGPQAARGLHADTYLVCETVGLVPTDTGVTIVPTHTFASCPREVDVLFVPSGMGTADVKRALSCGRRTSRPASTNRPVMPSESSPPSRP